MFFLDKYYVVLNRIWCVFDHLPLVLPRGDDVIIHVLQCGVSEVSTELILPIRRIRKLRRAPETAGGPLLSKMFSFYFSFLIWPAIMET